MPTALPAVDTPENCAAAVAAAAVVAAVAPTAAVAAAAAAAVAAAGGDDAEIRASLCLASGPGIRMWRWGAPASRLLLLLLLLQFALFRGDIIKRV